MIDTFLNDLINRYINDPENSDINYRLAQHYWSIGQTAAAVSFFIRTAERTDNDLLKYECLLRAAECFEVQGMRAFSVKGLLQHAVALIPNRPEAYYKLARFHEQENKEGDMFQCYMLSSIGLMHADNYHPPLRSPVHYPGKYSLLFEKAVSSWWCGLCEESRDIFYDLIKNYELDTPHRQAVINNLIKLGNLFNQPTETYTRDKIELLKHRFNNVELIDKNYSEAFQDMFILTALNGKLNGTYLEIGSSYPYYRNNTALLEEKFLWTGLSIDIEPSYVEQFQKERKNPCILKNACLIDYSILLEGLEFGSNIDYLQIDCDPAETSLNILLSIPFERFKFAVITFEHDTYLSGDDKVREISRKFLKSHGYELVVSNVAPDSWRCYEDWWVHPELVSSDILNKLKTHNDAQVTNIKEYFLGQEQ